MINRHAIAALGVATALSLGTATHAYADPTLGIELEQSGYSSVVVTGGTDPLVVNQGIGTFLTNVEVNNVSTNPLSIDLSSLNVNALGAGTLTIIASATGLTSPVGAMGFISQFSGNFVGSVVSATLQAFVSNTNQMFATTTPISGVLTGTSSPFAVAGGGSATTSAPFSITEVVTVSATGMGVASLDASTTAAPEIDSKSGGAAIALLLGVLALVGEWRKRSSSATLA